MSMNLGWIAESDWGYTSIAAVHMLGIAWFAVAWFTPSLAKLRWIGLTLMLISGALLVGSQPGRFLHNVAFWTKLVLIVLAVSMSSRPRIAVPLWAAVIVAGRLIPFF